MSFRAQKWRIFMGRSKSIKEQQESNKEFQEYVEAMNKNMEVHMGKTSCALDGMVTTHYAQFSDKALLIEGRYSHLTTMSEWSLDSVAKIVESCRNAIFGKPAPDGAKKNNVTEEVNNSIKAIKGRELFIANAAFDIIQGIMGSFSSKTTTSVESKMDGKPLSPGMTLFVGVMNNVYSRKDFFRNEKIAQSLFIFRVFYSIQEGQRVSKLNDLEAYENQKVAFRNSLKQISDAVMKLDVLSDDYMPMVRKLNERAECINTMLKAVDKKIQELGGGKDSAIEIATAEECDAIVASLRNRWQVAYEDWKMLE